MRVLTCLAFLLSGISAQANTITINLDDVGSTSGTFASIDSAGFHLAAIDTGTVLGIGGPNPGDPSLSWVETGQPSADRGFVMTANNGNTFALHSADFFSFYKPTTVRGYFLEGGSIEVEFPFVSLDLATQVFDSSWSNLVSVEFITFADPGVIDNIVVSQVPVPAALWLFGSALAGLGWLKRRRAA